MNRRDQPEPPRLGADWTVGPARACAAAALLLAATLGLVWSLAARRPLTACEAALALPDRRIDVNTADAAELRLLPGIGPALSARIVADRAQHGRFRDLEDLQRIRGVGPRTAAALAPHVVFDAAPPPRP